MPKKKSLIGYTTKNWFKEFAFPLRATVARLPYLARYKKNTFYFSKFREVKVRITIEQLPQLKGR